MNAYHGVGSLSVCNKTASQEFIVRDMHVAVTNRTTESSAAAITLIEVGGQSIKCAAISVSTCKTDAIE